MKSLSAMVKEDKKFKTACTKANVSATKRQASKYRNEKGIAWKVANGLAEPLTDRKQGALS